MVSVAECLNGQTVAVKSEAADDALAGATDERLVAKLLTLVYIGDMYLDNWALEGADAVLQCYTGMCIGTCVEHDAIIAEPHFLHLVNQLSLDITLEVVELDVSILLT